MSANQDASVLARKLALARGDDAQGGPGRGALKALRLALGRTAAEQLGLQLSVIGATRAKVGRDGLSERLGGDRLLLVLEADAGRKAVAALDRMCVSALIRQQTMGQVSATPPDDRPFTATDACLAAPLVVGVLQKAAALADGNDDRACLEGYRFGSRAENPASLMLVLDADRFRLFSLSVEFAAGALQGSLVLALPETDGPGAGSAGAAPGASSAGAKATLAQGFGAIRAELTAVLDRIAMPVSDLSRLEPGQCLPIRRQALRQTEIVAIDGQVLGTGRLGQAGGMRALRIRESLPSLAEGPVDGEPEFEAALAPPAMLPPTNAPAQGAEDATVDHGTPGLPAPKSETPTPREQSEPDDLMNLTPNEAAVEISELAGLSLEDTQDAQDTEHAPPDGA